MPGVSRRLFGLSLCASLLVVAWTQSSSAAEPARYRYGTSTFTYLSTYQLWQSQRAILGNPLGSEFNVTAANGTRGSWMRFERGNIFRIETGRFAGRTSTLRGGIGETFFYNRGINGSLGFPTGEGYVYNTLGHHAQVFEGGMIYWAEPLKQFVIGPRPNR